MFGLIQKIWTADIGSTLTQAASGGDTTLYVNQTYEFEGAASGTIGAETFAFEADEEECRLLLSAGVANGYPIGTDVFVSPARIQKYATVMFENTLAEVEVDASMWMQLPDGERTDIDAAEEVEIIDDRIVNVRHQTPSLFYNDGTEYWAPDAPKVPIVIPTTTPPATPTGLAASIVGIDTIQINWSWNSESNIEQYELHMGDTAGFTPDASNQIYVGKVNSLNYMHVGLGTTAHYLKLRAKNTSALYSEYTTAYATPTVSPPATPTGLTVTAGVGAVNVNWTANGESNIALYELHMGDTAGFTPSGSTLVYSGFATMARVTATYGVTKYFKLRAKNTSGQFSDYTAAVSGTAVAISADDLNTGVLNAEIDSLVGGGANVFGASGLVCKGGKFLFYSDTYEGGSPTSAVRIGIQSGDAQVAAFNASGQKALLGKSGTFYGLYIEGGMINVATASNAVTITDSGITATYAGTTKFQLSSSGVTLRDADMFLTGGGSFLLGPSPGAPYVSMSNAGIELASATDGIWCKNAAAVTVAKMNRDGITLDSTTDGLVIKSGGTKIVSLSSAGLKCWSGATCTTTLDASGISSPTIISPVITGGTFQTASGATSGIKITGTDYNKITFYSEHSAEATAGRIKCYQASYGWDGATAAMEIVSPTLSTDYLTSIKMGCGNTGGVYSGALEFYVKDSEGPATLTWRPIHDTSHITGRLSLGEYVALDGYDKSTGPTLTILNHGNANGIGLVVDGGTVTTTGLVLSGTSANITCDGGTWTFDRDASSYCRVLFGDAYLKVVTSPATEFQVRNNADNAFAQILASKLGCTDLDGNRTLMQYDHANHRFVITEHDSTTRYIVTTT